MRTIKAMLGKMKKQYRDEKYRGKEGGKDSPLGFLAWAPG